jgi:hypothetical protein
MTAGKAILVALLLVIAINLFLYGWLRRTVAAAKKRRDDPVNPSDT